MGGVPGRQVHSDEAEDLRRLGVPCARLWEAGGGVGDLTTCWFAGEHPDLWHRRCLETERVIVLTAQMLKLPLLVLHATGNRSAHNMRQLARFLGKTLKDPDAQYPHVHTPSEHAENEIMPPEDAPDENEDLWAGDWRARPLRDHGE